MIYLFVGSVGSGKTLSGVLEGMRRMSIGCHFFTNVRLVLDNVSTFFRLYWGLEFDPTLYHFLSEDDVLHLVEHVFPGPDRQHPNFILIDESQAYFDAREFATTARRQPALYHFIQQSRHVHCDLAFLCQRKTDLDKRVRGQAVLIYRHFNFSNIKVLGFKLRVAPYIYQREFLEDDRTLNDQNLIYINPTLYRCYEDTQLVRKIVGLPMIPTSAKPPNKVKFKLSWKAIRPIHIALAASFLLIFTFGCNRVIKTELLKSKKEVDGMKGELSVIVQTLKAYTNVPSRIAVGPHPPPLSDGSNPGLFFESESPDGALKISNVLQSGSYSELVMTSGRVLRPGMAFHHYIFQGCDFSYARFLNTRTKKSVLIPLAIYQKEQQNGENVSTNYPRPL